MSAGYRGFAAIWAGGAAVRATAGNKTANVTAYYYRKATPRAQMPIAYVVATYKRLTGTIPNNGQFPNSIPPYGQ